jgi:hypothetical protein
MMQLIVVGVERSWAQTLDAFLEEKSLGGFG